MYARIFSSLLWSKMQQGLSGSSIGVATATEKSVVRAVAPLAMYYN